MSANRLGLYGRDGHGRVLPIAVDLRERLVELTCAGLNFREAADRVGVSHRTAGRVWRKFGHMELKSQLWPGGLPGPVPPAVPGRRELTSEDRATIQAGLVLKLTYAKIGELIGRDKSTVSREIRRNSSPDGQYRGCVAHRAAAQRRHRPKPFKLIENTALCRRIEAWMDQGWSPRLIALMLAGEHSNDHTQMVSHETIYQALYVQTRGALRADLHQKLSLKRSCRRSNAQAQARRNCSPFKDAFKISDRPAEVTDRAVPGHWEGDLIVGPAAIQRSARWSNAPAGSRSCCTCPNVTMPPPSPRR